MRRTTPAMWLYSAAVLFLVGGCHGTQLTSRYEPLHPVRSQAVTFSLSATDKDGFRSAELYVYEYELYVNNGYQSAKRRTGGEWGLVDSWNYTGNPKSIDESHVEQAFPDKSFVSYLVRTTDSLGNKKSEQWYFAAGAWPFGNSPIPLFGNGAPAERIDVCFVADRDDYSTGRGMLVAVRGLIFDGYHTNNAIRGYNRKYWSFYYSPERGHISDYDAGAPYVLEVPASVASSGIIDHAAIIHTTVKRDFATGGNFGTEPTNKGTAVHESGHAAFGLADEYAGGGHFTSSDPHHNNYNSQSAAQTYNSNNGYPTGDVQNVTTGWWRPEPSSLRCIMLDDGDATMPSFARTCLRRAMWVYQELEN